jgi:hypothetical protein
MFYPNGKPLIVSGKKQLAVGSFGTNLLGWRSSSFSLIREL